MPSLSGPPYPQVHIEILSNETTTFGPTDAQGRNGASAKARRVIHDASSVGFSWYSRFPANAYWTLPQDSRHNADMNPGLDHVRIWYSNPATGYGPVLVFNGRLGDSDESGDDVVWTAWSYLSELALSRTGYNTMYANKSLAHIITQEWSGSQSPPSGTAKYSNYGANVQDHSLLGHITTGTIQSPVNSTGGITVRTDSQFGVNDVSRLLLLFDLTELGRANTTNNVVMEISRSTTPTFNFWSNRGSAYTSRKLLFPGNVLDFRYVRGVLDIRNDLATIGTKKSSAVEIIKTVTGGTYGINAFGRRQDTFTVKTLGGYKNIDDEATGKFNAQTQITAAAVKQASKPTKAIRVDILPDVFEPYDGWDIEDTVVVELKNGRTNINATYRIVGTRAIMDGAGFRNQLLLVDPSI